MHVKQPTSAVGGHRQAEEARRGAPSLIELVTSRWDGQSSDSYPCPMEGTPDVLAVADYVERVRLGWERELAAKAAKLPLPLAPAVESEEGMWPEGVIALTPSLAPRTIGMAHEVARILHFEEPFIVVQTPKPCKPNGQAWMERPFRIRLIGQVATLLDDGALRALLGHEMGHLIAHGSYGRQKSDDALWEKAPLFASRFSVARELTADRFALLGCQDVDAAVRLEVASYTYESPSALKLDPEAHRKQCTLAVEAKRAQVIAHGGTHPTKEFRVHATWLFSRTEVYRELTGKGPGDLQIAEVDALLREACIAEPLRAPVKEKKTDDLPESKNPPAEPTKTKVTKDRDDPPVLIPLDSRPIDWLAVRTTELAAKARALVARKAPDSGAPIADHPESIDLDDVDIDDLEARFRALESGSKK